MGGGLENKNLSRKVSAPIKIPAPIQKYRKPQENSILKNTLDSYTRAPLEFLQKLSLKSMPIN